MMGIMFTLLVNIPVTGSAEYVFKKDGSIIEGVIQNEINYVITLKDSKNKILKIHKNDVIRILYTEQDLRQVFVQKIDGNEFVAYLVDEGREEYIFRYELYKPQEFIIPRKDIHTIKTRNPSALKVDGEIGTGSADLKWSPPYYKVKKYKVYYKKSLKEKYEKFLTCNESHIELNNLQSNTNYYIIVTSLDEADVESIPTNEISIITANISPESPGNISLKKISLSDAEIKWSPSADPDGRVVKYKIYIYEESKRKLLAEIKKTEVILKNLSKYEMVEVTAVDDHDSESLPAGVRIFLGNRIISISSEAIYPMGKFAELTNPGYGVTLYLSEREVYTEDFEFGVETGFYYFPGKNFKNNDETIVDSILCMPLHLVTGYHMPLTDYFSVVPSVMIGAAYFNVQYSTWSSSISAFNNNTTHSFDLSAKCMISLEFLVSQNFLVSLTGGLGTFIEKGNNFYYSSAKIDFGYRF